MPHPPSPTPPDRSGRRLLVLTVAVVALVASACSSGSDDDGSQGVDPPDTATSDDGGTTASGAGVPAEATFTEGSCGFELPSGTSPRCGTVTVPEDWATGQGQIVLPVAVFASTADNPAPDPVIYLEGGPGGHSLDTLRFITSDLLEPLQDRGDVVFFDQRGAGRAQPRLECDELTVVTRELEDTPSVPVDEREARYAQALVDCRARFESQGIDVEAYNTVNNAYDVEAIRAALGYDSWNLYGISYGTKLALEVMRQHPDGVRTVIIDSVFPPEVDSTRDNPRSFVDSWQAVVEACAQEEPCRAAGDLAQRYRDIVTAYDTEPIQVEVEDYLTGETDQVWVDGESIVGIVLQALYSPTQFADLPELAAELEQAETDALSQFLSTSRTNEPFFSSGMFYAFECNEEIPFALRAEVAAAMPEDPFGRLEVFDYASNNGPSAFETCRNFGAGTPDLVANEPVVSDIPTLVMAGRFDPVTPVAWAELAASRLPASHLVVAPRASHGVSTDRCGMDVMRQFLDDPGTAPDASCFEEADLRFLLPPPTEVELEPVTFPAPDPSLTITTVRPRDWLHTDLDGDSLRQDSTLDPTEIIQLAGDEVLFSNLEFFLSDSYGLQLSAPVDTTRGGREWRYRSGADASRAVEWYETEINGHATVVILIAQPSDREALVAAVLEPALDNIDVTG